MNGNHINEINLDRTLNIIISYFINSNLWNINLVKNNSNFKRIQINLNKVYNLTIYQKNIDSI